MTGLAAPLRTTGLVVATVLLAACSGGGTSGGDASASRSGSPSGSPSDSPSASSSGRASGSASTTLTAPTPPAGACHALSYAQVVAPAVPARPARCAGPHTAETFAVGELSTVHDGHLLSVDSQAVRDQAARACRSRFLTYVGGNREQRRLSMLRAVWFTPTVEQSDAGAEWYRCDVIAVAADDRLATVTGRLEGVLSGPRGKAYALCGTAEPGTRGFRRVLCREKHSWEAIRTVDLPPGRYPGEKAVRAAGQEPCQDAGRDVARDALDYQWGYEWPTREQWASGQTYGICWAPAS